MCYQKDTFERSELNKFQVCCLLESDLGKRYSEYCFQLWQLLRAPFWKSTLSTRGKNYPKSKMIEMFSSKNFLSGSDSICRSKYLIKNEAYSTKQIGRYV